MDGRLWLNAGAIGMPANDGTPRAWYALLTPRGGTIEVTFHTLVYDHAAPARAMAARGLPPAYAQALSTGLWPSMDVLPPAERRARGHALAPRGLDWPAATRFRRFLDRLSPRAYHPKTVVICRPACGHVKQAAKRSGARNSPDPSGRGIFLRQDAR